MGSSGVVGFTRVRPGGRRVHPGSLGSLTCALRFVGFIWRRWLYSCALSSIVCALGVVGFIRGRWIHSGVPWGSIGSSAVVGFTRVRPEGRRVHPGSLV